MEGGFSGPVTVRSGGDLALIGASVNGPITAMGAASVLLCGSSVQGPVTLTDATGAVELGGGPGSACAQDKLNGPVTVFGGHASTSIEGTAFVGPLSVASNSGARDRQRRYRQWPGGHQPGHWRCDSEQRHRFHSASCTTPAPWG